MDHLPRHLDLRRHLGEPELQRLVLEDRLAEGDPLLGVGERRLERRPRHADRLRADADPPALEAGERDLQPLAFLAEQVLRRDAAVLEQDLRRVAGVLAELVLEPGDAVAGRRVGTMKALMPFLPAALSVTAMTIATSPFLPLVMNCLTPFST